MSDWKSDLNHVLKDLDHIHEEKDKRLRAHSEQVEHFFAKTLPEFVEEYRRAIHEHDYAIQLKPGNNASTASLSVLWSGRELFTSQFSGMATAEVVKLVAQTIMRVNMPQSMVELTKGLTGLHEVTTEKLANYLTALIKENGEALNKQL